MTKMTVTRDALAGAAYINLIGEAEPGEAVRNVGACGGKLVLDFNAAGHLIGIEVLDFGMLHPVFGQDLKRGIIQMLFRRIIRRGGIASD
jgi:uncharacterized protein YuzE